MRARRGGRVRRLLLPSLVVVAGLAGSAVLAFADPAPWRPMPGRWLASGRDFSLTGAVANLAPGAAGSLPVTASNPYGEPISVTTITATVARTLPGCPAGELSLGGVTFAGNPPAATVSGLAAEVPAAGSTTIRLPVLLARSAGNGCQATAFRFIFSGDAVPLRFACSRQWCHRRRAGR
jgi:hypothetical protein